jgi:hypothetical protein
MYQLNNLTLLGKGGYKLVYQHPTQPDKAIKVMNRNRISENGDWAHLGRLKRSHAQGVYKQFRRELIQYLQLCKNHYKTNTFSFPIETPFGFVETDQGLGLIVEKIISPNGKGITLYELCRTHQFNDTHAQALKEFFDACCELHIVYGEVNIAGIMYTEQRNAKPEFVLVDGMGDKLFIPLRSMSKSLNAKNVRKIEMKIRQEMDRLLNTPRS